MKSAIALSIFLWCAAACASNYPRVDEDIETYDRHVTQLTQAFAKRAPAHHDKEWVKAKLQHMVDVDQYTRHFSDVPARREYSNEERIEFSQRFPSLAVDQRNTADLKELLKIYPWFTISEFGGQADFNAWLLVQHADHDPEFQRDVLEILEPLAIKGESNARNFAYLYDRVAASYSRPAERKPQRYGTQGMCTGPGTWEPLPVEEPEKLEERRADLGLQTMAEYKKGFVCHESLEDTLRRHVDATAAKGEDK